MKHVAQKEIVILMHVFTHLTKIPKSLSKYQKIADVQAKHRNKSVLERYGADSNIFL